MPAIGLYWRHFDRAKCLIITDVFIFLTNSLWFAYQRLIKTPQKKSCVDQIFKLQKRLNVRVYLIYNVPVAFSEQGIIQITWQKAFINRLKILGEW